MRMLGLFLFMVLVLIPPGIAFIVGFVVGVFWWGFSSGIEAAEKAYDRLGRYLQQEVKRK